MCWKMKGLRFNTKYQYNTIQSSPRFGIKNMVENEFNTQGATEYYAWHPEPHSSPLNI